MISSPARPRLLLLATLFIAFLLLPGCLDFLNSSPAAPAYNPPPATLPPQQYVQPTPLVAPPASNLPLEITFINVSYGDATLMRSNGLTVLFDTGPADTAPQVASVLRSKGVDKIDVLILSSNNPLNIGGAPSIMRQFIVGQLWTTGVNYTDTTSQSVAQLAQFVPTRTVRYGYTQSWGPFNLTVLNPADPLTGNPDADSIALKASYGSFCSLLFSSSEASGAAGNDGGTVVGGVDARILSGSIPIQCPVMRISHHGSGNSASFQLLDHAGTETGIISVGPNPPQNAYPEPTVIRRLLLSNVSVYVTDRLGSITVVSNGNGYNISSEQPADQAYWHFINDVGYNGASYWPK